MKKILSALLVAALIGLPTMINPTTVRADDKSNDEDRIQSAWTSPQGDYGHSGQHPAEPD